VREHCHSVRVPAPKSLHPGPCTLAPWRTCSIMLKTSGCAFSISSNSTTVYGRRRHASAQLPPRSTPRTPGATR